ncbi:MAG: NADPH-dependent FMN reductase [Cellvibrio sp.]|jgi:chromate reductase
MKLIAISGSLRKGSFSTALLRAAEQELPEGTAMELVSIADIPVYNEDLDGEDKPAAVTRLKEAVAAADGLLIATPEYNYSLPGGLKNALDWLSRPAFKSVLAHKPAAIMSVSKGPTGGVRAQAQLKQVLAAVLAETYPAPELMVPVAHEVFSDAGALTDEGVKTRLHRFITEYQAWIEARFK